LRDIVDYELTISLSLIKTAYLYKEDLLYNFYKMCKDSIKEGQKGFPYAFIFPPKQLDYPTTLRMRTILKLGGAEIHQARDSFMADGKEYPAGSFVILMSQPYRPYVKGILEERVYPNIQFAQSLRDNASWTLPMQMGVSFSRIDHPFETKLDKLDNIPYPAITPPGSSPYIVLDSRVNASYSVVFALLGEKAEVYRTKDKFKGEGFKVAAGSFIIKNSPQVQKALPALLDKWHSKAYEIEDITDIPKAPLKNPRIGIYQSWRSNMDEGWTRYVFDDFEIPFTTLHNKDFKGLKNEKTDLKEKFDAIVFADESPDIIKTGKPNPRSPYARYFTGGYPPEYEGGIGNEGIDALRTFVEKGGILVALNNASSLFTKEFRAPVRNVLEGVSRDKFFSPKSLFKIKINNTTPLGYGMPTEAAAMFYQSLAFGTNLPSTSDWENKVVAIYPEANILLRGGVYGEELITRKAAVIDTRYKKGHLILIGFLCQHRAQTHGTYNHISFSPSMSDL
jgi:hypothetical protein